MWALPDIKRLNKQAAAGADELRAQVEAHLDERGEPAKCQCGRDVDIVYSEVYFDIFSDDPKGAVHQCRDCLEDNEALGDVFRCCDCGRLFIESCTPEPHSHQTGDGKQLCLNCYAKREILNPNNWVGLSDQDIAAVDIEIVRHALHLFPTSGPRPPELEEHGTVCFDNRTGGEVLGTCFCSSSPDSGVESVRQALRKAKADGHKRALIVLDGVFPFAVNITVYTANEELAAELKGD